MDTKLVLQIVVVYLLVGFFVAATFHDTGMAAGRQMVGIALFWPLALLLVGIVGFVLWIVGVIRER